MRGMGGKPVVESFNLLFESDTTLDVTLIKLESSGSQPPKRRVSFFSYPHPLLGFYLQNLFALKNRSLAKKDLLI